MEIAIAAVVAVVEYIEVGAEYFEPAEQDMLNDAFLGISVVALALVVWVVYVLIKDPKHTVRDILAEKGRKSDEQAERRKCIKWLDSVKTIRFQLFVCILLKISEDPENSCYRVC